MHGRVPGSGHRRRRCEFHSGCHAGGCQARYLGSSRRGRPPKLRPNDARGNKPRCHRCARRLPVHDKPRRRSELEGRRRATGADPFRRECHDRHASPAPGTGRRTRYRFTFRPRVPRLCLDDFASSFERRRSGCSARHPPSGAGNLRICTGHLPHPPEDIGSHPRVRIGRTDRRPSPDFRSVGLSGVPKPDVESSFRYDRFGWNAGGDDNSWCALLDDSQQHRTTHNDFRRYERAGRHGTRSYP